MAEKWKDRAQRAEEEARQAGRAILQMPALVRWCERAIRFLLGTVLAGAELFGGCAPFALGLTAASGPGLDGLCALVGACFGYLVFRGFAEGLRCAAACVLVFSVQFAFWDVAFLRRGWAVPVVTAALDALTGFAYLGARAWRTEEVVAFSTEILLAGASAYLYRLALSPWRGREEDAQRTPRQVLALAYLGGTGLMALTGVRFLGELSLGRTAAVVLVMTAAHAAGPGAGAAAGVAAGACVDLAGAAQPFYAMAYGFSGLLTGAGWRQGRLFAALTYVVTGATAVLWTWDSAPHIACLYENFIASVIFLLLPQKWIRQAALRLKPQAGEEIRARALAAAAEKLRETAGAFRHICESLRRAFPPMEPNDADASEIFDRTAQRVCRNCALRSSCWEREYVSTFNALNDALPVMLERGRGEASDLPGWFTSRCVDFPAFLRTANEELTALLYRREYRARLAESRGAVREQYEALSQVLGDAARSLGEELTADPRREKVLRAHLAALDIEGEAAVWYDAAGRLRAEVTGTDLEALRTAEELRRISALLRTSLRLEEAQGGRVVFSQAEPLMAVAGVAGRRREGQSESGDTGTWFKRADGSLFVLLCDGMGSGSEARRESGLAVRLLEEFLGAGMETVAALRTVCAALGLKNEESGAFTTVDLLRLDLFTGEGEVCKYGAAPTYLRKGASVSRLAGESLPAGLAQGGPHRTTVRLGPGDWAVMLSDGVADPEDDGWVRELIAGCQGDSPKELARALMAESEKRVGPADDRTAVVVHVEEREK